MREREDDENRQSRFFSVKCASFNISGQFYKYKKFLPIDAVRTCVAKGKKMGLLIMCFLGLLFDICRKNVFALFSPKQF